MALNHNAMRRCLMVLLSVVLFLVLGGIPTRVRASIVSLPLPAIEPDEWTDIQGTLKSLKYVAATQTLSFSGLAMSIDIGEGGIDYSFVASLAATPMNLTSLGDVLSGGIFTIKLLTPNTLPASYGGVNSVLLSGQITKVQFNGTNVLNVLFTNIEGTAATHYGGYEGVGGMILGSPIGKSSFDGTDFLTKSGTVDVLGTVPEPSSFFVFGILVLSAGMVVSYQRRLRLESVYSQA